MKNIKQKLKDNKKVLRVISIVLVVYIFVSVIGYSFFRETLKISGNVSTQKLSKCPFELQELTSKLYDSTDGVWRLYYAEPTSFVQNKDPDAGLGGLETATYRMHMPFSYYNKSENTLSILSTHDSLYPNDPKFAEWNIDYIYNYYNYPIYFVFKNTTSVNLNDFIIEVDEDNSPMTPREETDPLQLFDIRYVVLSDVEDVRTIIADDLAGSFLQPASWLSFESIFKDRLNGQDYINEVYYNYEEFQYAGKLEFSTEDIGLNEYLVVGIRFPRTLTSTSDLWGQDDGFGVDHVIKDPDGIAFKFYPASFDETSAFHVRIAFENIVERTLYFEMIGNPLEQEVNEFYDNPGAFEPPVYFWPYN